MAASSAAPGSWAAPVKGERLEPLPVTRMPQREANAALMRPRGGAVTGRIVLVADAA